jgi:hypothetical protein
MDRIGARRHRRDQRVAGLVICGVLLLFVRKNHRPALDAHHHFVFGHLEVDHHDEFAVLARGPQRRLVHQVRQVRARKARRAARDDGQIHVIADWHLAGVHAENLFAALDVGTRDHHTAVETARPQ